MKKIILAQAITVSLLTLAAAGTVSAHDLLGGSLGASQNSVDVFRTNCFQWMATVPNTTHVYGPTPKGESTSGARGFLAAISLTAGTTVTATIGFNPKGNVNGNSVGNNVLPASPAPMTLSVSDTKVGAAWNVNGTSPEFNASGVAPIPFGQAGYLDSKTAGAGNGEYVIVVSHASAVATNYDFIGHCTNAPSGPTNAIHTGQGADFVLTKNYLAPTFDYDQLIDQ